MTRISGPDGLFRIGLQRRNEEKAMLIPHRRRQQPHCASVRAAASIRGQKAPRGPLNCNLNLARNEGGQRRQWNFLVPGPQLLMGRPQIRDQPAKSGAKSDDEVMPAVKGTE
jgi:hypothetical protein